MALRSLAVHLDYGVAADEDLALVLPHQPPEDGSTPVGHVPELDALIGVVLVDDLDLVASPDLPVLPDEGHLLVTSPGVVLVLGIAGVGHAHSPRYRCIGNALKPRHIGMPRIEGINPKFTATHGLVI